MALSVDRNGRDRLIAEVSKAGKDLVWRDKHEKRLFPRSFERALVLALKRSLSQCQTRAQDMSLISNVGTFILSFSVRAGVNILLMVFRSFRRRKIRLAMIRHALFGAEPFRFGAMIGEKRSFTSRLTST